MDDAEKARLDAAFEPAGWSPPDNLNVDDLLALAAAFDRRGADVLADRLQAEGPDEFPRGYYDAMADEILANDGTSL